MAFRAGSLSWRAGTFVLVRQIGGGESARPTNAPMPIRFEGQLVKARRIRELQQDPASI